MSDHGIATHGVFDHGSTTHRMSNCGVSKHGLILRVGLATYRVSNHCLTIHGVFGHSVCNLGASING